jgi:hypothetical protein
MKKGWQLSTLGGQRIVVTAAGGCRGGHLAPRRLAGGATQLAAPDRKPDELGRDSRVANPGEPNR